MAKGQGSRARYKAMLADVENRAYCALNRGETANPYPVEDKRHARFDQKLRQIQALDHDFRDTYQVMGGDLSELKVRERPDPGPVESVEVLGIRWQEEQAQRERETADLDWDD